MSTQKWRVSKYIVKVIIQFLFEIPTQDKNAYIMVIEHPLCLFVFLCQTNFLATLCPSQMLVLCGVGPHHRSPQCLCSE